MAKSLWSNVNTCFEIGIEVCRLLEETGETKGSAKGVETEKIADGVLLMSDNEDVLIAVKEETAKQALSEAAAGYGQEKDGYIVFSGAATAIPLFELARVNAGVRDYIVSEESLRATLCGNFPEYVKTHNMTAPPGEQIEDADAPPYLFLQKQLDNAADETRAEVHDFQESRANDNAAGNGIFEDVLELER